MRARLTDAEKRAAAARDEVRAVERRLEEAAESARAKETTAEGKTGSIDPRRALEFKRHLATYMKRLDGEAACLTSILESGGGFTATEALAALGGDVRGRTGWTRRDAHGGGAPDLTANVGREGRCLGCKTETTRTDRERVGRGGVDDAEWRETSRGEGRRADACHSSVTFFSLSTGFGRRATSDDESRFVIVERHVIVVVTGFLVRV